MCEQNLLGHSVHGQAMGGEGKPRGPIPAGSWRLWVAPTSRSRDMEGLELAARVSQCGRTPPLHKQFRHHSRPGHLGEGFGSSPSLAGFGRAGDGQWSRRAPGLHRDGGFRQGVQWEGAEGDPVSSPGWVMGAQAGTCLHGQQKEMLLGDAVSLATLCGLVASYSCSVCSHRIRDIGGDVPVQAL